MDKFLTYLEPAVHLALIVLIAVTAWTYWQSTSQEGSGDPPTIETDSSEVLSGWRPSESRVLLFVSSTCKYCLQSLDFYARLGRTVDSLQRAGVPLSLAAVIDGSDAAPVQRQILRSNEVKVDTLLRVTSLRSVGVSGTPTIVFLQRDGTSHSWIGLQDSTGEREILSAVKSVQVRP